MWGAIESLAVALVIALLQVVIKNPGAVKTEKATIAQIASLATEADTAVNATVWTHTP